MKKLLCLLVFGTILYSGTIMGQFVTGQVYYDANSNCFKEPSENPGNNIKINVYQGGNLMQQVYTSQYGFYTFDAPLGTYDYSVDTIGKPFLVSCPPTGQFTSILTSVDSIDTGMNFGLECKPGFDVGVYSVSLHNSAFIPGDTVEVFIKAGDLDLIYNLNCTSSLAGAMHIDYTGSVTYAGPVLGSLTPVAGGNSLDYTITDFGAINPDSAFRFYLVTDTAALPGSVCLNINVTPTGGDLDTSNNYRTHCFTINTSINPNNKQVYPIGDITANQDWLYYTINFQNYLLIPVQNVMVTDGLHASLQESSFTFLGASHNVFVHVDINNIVWFTFPNINLPTAATDPQGSRGQILYKVKLDPGLGSGIIIHNTAAIYMSGIMYPTNTTINTILNPFSITEVIPSQVTLYPNPTNNEIYVNYTSTDCNYSIIELTGRIVLEGRLINGTNRIVTEKLPAGIYMIRIDSEPTPLYRKFAVSR